MFKKSSFKVLGLLASRLSYCAKRVCNGGSGSSDDGNTSLGKRSHYSLYRKRQFYATFSSDCGST